MYELPNNIEAELHFLSSIFLDNNVMYFGLEKNLKKDDFYDNKLGIVFESMHNIHKNNLNINIVTVSDELKKLGYLDVIGGLDRLYELNTYSLTPVHADINAKIIKEKSILRQLIKLNNKINSMCHDNVDILDIRGEFLSNIEFIDKNDGTKEEKSIDILADTILNIGNKKTYYDSGIRVLDNHPEFKGFEEGELIILAARPGNGKSTVMMNMAEYVAEQGHKSSVFGLEMRSQANLSRLLCKRSRIPMSEWINRQDEIADIAGNMEFVDNINMYDSISRSNGILSKIKRDAQNGVKYFFIDYLGLVSVDNFQGNRNNEIGKFTRELKQLAQSENVIIVLLSQLNRSVENIEQGRERGRPRKEHLRDSGNIEQDANKVIFLYRPILYDEYMSPGDEEDVLKIVLDKDRNGPSIEVETSYDFSLFDINTKKV